MSKCYHDNILNTSASARRPWCKEKAVPDRLYCAAHLYEALQRVAMVSPVDPLPPRWSGQPRGSMLNTRESFRRMART